MATLHIIGAGLAGLAAAVEASRERRWSAVRVYEAAGRAGGRCRSYHDERLDRLIDNGNHLMLSANDATFAYLEETGGRSTVRVVQPAEIPFLDLRTGERWSIRPTSGPLPLWLLARNRRTAGAGLGAHIRSIRAILGARQGATVAEALSGTDDRLFARFWDPMTRAVLNTRPEAASARLLAGFLSTILRSGEAGMRPCIADGGLAAALVEPALGLLARRGVEITFGARVRAIGLDSGRVFGFDIGRSDPVMLESGDAVVLAVPPEIAGELLPELETPRESNPILNLHFRLRTPAALPGGLPLLGLIGGTAQWLFVRNDVLSVTISVADDLVDRSAAEIAAPVWDDICRALGYEGAMPACRVIKEKRATFAQTEAELARRPGPDIGLANLRLAGDWTDTSLPATIEGAIRSGIAAARLAAPH